jgi:predicted metalloprotease
VDKKAYLDTDFFSTMAQRLGAEGDFAAAYVVAHEVAHHVQNELGILGQANRIRQQSSMEDSNAISVRIELQADCYSGVWARKVQSKFGSLERGDIAEAMNAAKQIGDDTLQRNATQENGLIRTHSPTGPAHSAKAGFSVDMKAAISVNAIHSAPELYKRSRARL